MKKNYTNLRNIYNSLNDKSSQPKLAGNQKHPHKLEKKVMSRKEIILNHKNEMENKEEVMTDDREKDRVYLRRKKIKLWLKGKRTEST